MQSWLALQLYHAKAETRISGHAGNWWFNVATLPCQSGNVLNERRKVTFLRLQLYHAKAETGVLAVGVRPAHRCNFTMPKRKPTHTKGKHTQSKQLQLYHAKAETIIWCTKYRKPVCCNFTMPKRKRFTKKVLQSREVMLQLYHAKAETSASLV